MAAIAELIQAIRAPNVAATAFAQRRSEMKRAMGLDDSFGALCPAAKTRALAEPNASSAELVSFLDSGAQMNIPQQFRASLPDVASGAMGYVEFCRLINVSSSPPPGILTGARRW